MSVSDRRMPVTSAPIFSSFAASGIATSAMRRSYSYMPTERMPVTSNERMRGRMPTGVTSPSATISTTRSPTEALSSSASALPRITR
jgi:hypothetical protein